MGDEAEILFEVRGGVGFVRLNRPQALNALSLTLIKAFDAQLKDWAEDPAVHAVVVRGAGERAYCAGGDIRGIWEAGRTAEGSADGPAAELFRHEYMLVRRIKVFPKPYVALIGGIAMGGGVGLCVHGSHRVATERTLLALPETRIGLFPDVGSSSFLPRLPGALGPYLGLTGARMKAADALYAGLADHYVVTARLAELEDALAVADWSVGPAGAVVSAAIRAFESGPPELAVLTGQRAAIDRCFGRDTIEAILAALEAEDGPWAAKTLETLRACSPTSLKVTVAQLRRGADLDFDAAMIVEYRLSQAFLARHDFHEGIRAMVIDKDNAPRWDPSTLAAVTRSLVEAHFAPLGARDLSFD